MEHSASNPGVSWADGSTLLQQPGVAVSFQRLRKSFGQSAAPVLDDISLDIYQGEVLGIIGRSGAGKSTLLRTINRLERASSGRVIVGETDMLSLDKAELLRARRGIGMVFQGFNLLTTKTVFENVALPMRAAGAPREKTRQAVERVLALVGLDDRASAYPSELSGGQKQRVGIARALVHEPSLLLCDEPTSALDPETTQSILALLAEINRSLGVTIVLITHEYAVVKAVCHRVAALDRGHLVEVGKVWEVFGAPRSEAIKALLEPHGVKLPVHLQQRLLADPPASGGAVIVVLRLAGNNGSELAFGAVLARFGPTARLLASAIDNIQGRAVGELLIMLDADGFSLPLADDTRLLGYLPDSTGN